MPTRKRNRLRRVLRIAYLALLLFALLLVGTAFYLNKVGLPGFLKRPLVAQLQERGIDLEFSRMRLRWHRGIVAENVVFGRAELNEGPLLNFKEIQIGVVKPQLFKLRFQVDSLLLKNGSLVWPVAETNGPNRALFLDDIQTRLRLAAPDLWELDRFEAEFAGARMKCSASITNPASLRDWDLFQPREKADMETINRRLRKLLDVVESLKFVQAPDLLVRIWGDASELESMQGEFHLAASGAETPWGTLESGDLTGRVFPSGRTNSTSRAELTLRANRAVTRWGSAEHLELVVGCAVESLTQTSHADVQLRLQADNPASEWGQCDTLHFSSQWRHSFTNAMPLFGRGELAATNVNSPRGRAATAKLSVDLAETAEEPASESMEDWAWWSRLAPYRFGCKLQLSDLETDEVSASSFGTQGTWQAPWLTLTNLHAELYGGEVAASARLDVGSRQVEAICATDFDLHRIDHLLTEKSRRWINQFSWERPPEIEAALSAILPAWTNREPDWRGEVRPTLVITGGLETAACAFRGVSAESARTHFHYTNMMWHLPDLHVVRPEGTLDIVHQANDRTQDYYWKIKSSIDPKALRPLLETNADKAFELTDYTSPPLVNAEIWGRWYRHDLIGARGHVTVTNFSFRGQRVDSGETDFSYTNLILEATHLRVQSGGRTGTLDLLRADFPERKVHLTNGISTLDPMLIARMIGPITARSLEPYRFLEPPRARVNGVAPIQDIDLADLHFEVEGGPFEWWRFRSPHVRANIHWEGMTLALTNAQMQFYEGEAWGHAGFLFHTNGGTDFNFDLTTANTSLSGLMQDLHGSTNRLEGTLDGRLVITHANTRDPLSWHGGGTVTLTNGYLWSIPMFGIFSPILDAFWPGLGKSIADEGSATFSIANSLIHSDDLEIRAPTLRMQYRGTVDFEGNVNARVEAELWRDAWLLPRAMGMILTPFTKLFEYDVTGTLGNPKSEPRHIPKLFMFPLQPFQTLKDVFTPETSDPPARSKSPAPGPEAREP